ncbi:MAG: serine O-acetyltransferase [Desulfobulbus sp.]|jgi:serine O-acetyltransferase
MSKIVILIHKIVYAMSIRNIPFVPSVINKATIRLLFGCQLGCRTKLGENVILGYGGLGVVIHERCVIGNNVMIGTCVTIGGTTKKYDVPVIGDNTIISTGAKVLGPVKVGRNCVIGANAVVLSDIPDNSLVVGIPAKVIKNGIDIRDYREF